MRVLVVSSAIILMGAGAAFASPVNEELSYEQRMDALRQELREIHDRYTEIDATKTIVETSYENNDCKPSATRRAELAYENFDETKGRIPRFVESETCRELRERLERLSQQLRDVTRSAIYNNYKMVFEEGTRLASLGDPKNRADSLSRQRRLEAWDRKFAAIQKELLKLDVADQRAAVVQRARAENLDRLAASLGRPGTKKIQPPVIDSSVEDRQPDPHVGGVHHVPY